jgi:hypothetical protein
MKFGNMKYDVSVGILDDKVFEVFVTSKKRSNDSDDIARDFGLVLSLALQHGCTFEEISSALGEKTFAGAVIQTIEEMMSVQET